ncbi:hypothetical protein CHELA20_52137 [Hyphomicrobiales bacterium]|nr:hypothetical protein CHELA20_52137 [Hyphomicrobiales bacterium]
MVSEVYALPFDAVAVASALPSTWVSVEIDPLTKLPSSSYTPLALADAEANEELPLAAGATVAVEESTMIWLPSVALALALAFPSLWVLVVTAMPPASSSVTCKTEDAPPFVVSADALAFT